MSHPRHWLLWPLLLGLLAGCAGRLPDGAPPGSAAPAAAWRAWQAEVAALPGFRLQGKVGIRVADHAGGGGGSASLDWTQQADRYQLDLVAPLGQGSVALQGDRAGAQLRTGSELREVRGDPARALHRELGWSVPVHALRWWARGLPEPDRPVADLLAVAGVTASFRQAGWRVLPDRWAPVAGLQLPRRVVLEGPDARLVLLVRQWFLFDENGGLTSPEPS